MKRKVLTIAFICLFVLFAACSGADNKTNKDSKSDVEVNAEQNGVGDSPSVDGEAVYTAKQEILEAKWYSGMIQINDKVIKLPVSLSELLDMGFDYQIDKGQKNKDYMFAQWNTATYDLMLNGKKVFSQSLYYEGDELATLEQINPKIGYISGNEEDTEDIKFFLPGGLTLGDAMSEVEKKLGKADKMDTQYGVFSYTYAVPIKPNYYACEFGVYVELNRDTQTVSEFRIAKNVNSSKLEDSIKLEMTRIENYNEYAIQVLFPNEHLVFGGNGSASHWSTLVEINGDIFKLRLEPSIYSQEYFNLYKDHSLQHAHTLLYEATDKNGAVRKVYYAEEESLFGELFYFNSSYVLEFHVILIPYSNKEANVNKIFQEYIVDFGKMIDFKMR